MGSGCEVSLGMSHPVVCVVLADSDLSTAAVPCACEVLSERLVLSKY